MNHSLTLDQFNYDLPQSLIAQRPAQPRDTSRLLVIDRQLKPVKRALKHGSQFKDLAATLSQKLNNDCILVRNNTKVIPARILGSKKTGGQVELLLLKKIGIKTGGQTQPSQELWECLTKPGLKPGQTVDFSQSDNFCQSELEAKCLKIKGFSRLISFNQMGQKFMTSLIKIGQTPTPPYIDWFQQDEPKLRKQYQTVYAKYEGSAAAPTAGLHFTPKLNQQLQAQGVEIEEVTLHVGLGTFQPVKTNDISLHQMHAEWYRLNRKTANCLNRAKIEGKKIIAVGTTSTRVLESCANQNGLLEAGSGETDIFITPGYKFKFTQGLITNFHLPKSTLLMLVSALVTEPNTNHKFSDFKKTLIGQAYQQAIAKNYRFYSFGDAMLIL